MAAPPWFVVHLEALRDSTGMPNRPTLDKIAEWAKQAATDPKAAPSRSTLAGWFTGERFPRSWEALATVITGVAEKGKFHGGSPEPLWIWSLPAWRSTYERAAAEQRSAEPASPVAKAGAEAASQVEREVVGEPKRSVAWPGLAAYGRGDADRFFGREADINAVRERVADRFRATAGGLLGILAPSGVGKSSLVGAGLLPRVGSIGLPGLPAARWWPSVVITPGQDPFGALTAAVPTLVPVVAAAHVDPGAVRAAVATHLEKVAQPRLIVVVDGAEQLLGDDEASRTFIATLDSVTSEAAVVVYAVGQVRIDGRRLSPLRAELALREDATALTGRLRAMTDRALVARRAAVSAAGLLTETPVDADGAVWWPSAVITPGRDPLTALSAALPTLGPLTAGDPPSTDVVRAAVAAHVRDLVTPMALIVVVDQFEELLQADPPVAAEFCEVLAAIATRPAPDWAPPGVVVVAARDDFYSELRRLSPHVQAALDTPYNLNGLSREQLIEVIRESARQAGLNAPRELYTQLLADVGLAEGDTTATVGGKLPLISHVLGVMAEGNTLSLRAYKAAKGVSGAVAATANSAWLELQGAQIEQVGLEILVQLVRVGERGQDTRRRVERADLLAAASPGGDTTKAERALRILATARLISVAGTTVEITHEALLREWRQLRARISERRADLALRQQVEDAAREYDDDGKTHRLVAIAAAQDQRRAPSRSDTDRLRLGSLIRAALRDLRWLTGRTPEDEPALDLAARQVLATAMKRRALLRLGWATGALTVAGAVGGFAIAEAGRVSQQKLTEWFTITDRAQLLEGTEPSLAAMFDVIAYQRQASGNLATRILSAASWPLSYPVAAAPLPVSTLVFSHDGRFAATGDDGHFIRIWSIDPAAGRATRISEFPAHDQEVYYLALSPDGRTLASASHDHRIALWDVRDWRRVTRLGQPLTGHADAVNSLTWLTNTTLASASADSTIGIWDTSDRAHTHQIAVLRQHRSDINGLDTITSAGKRLMLSGSDDESVILWDATQPQAITPLARIPCGQKSVQRVCFSPTAPVMATCGSDGSLALWNHSDPARCTQLGTTMRTGVGNSIYALRFAPDGLILYSGGKDPDIHRWSVANPATPSPCGPALVGHSQIVYSTVPHPNGRLLGSTGQDRQLRLWHLPPVLAGHRDAVTGVATTADGSRVVTSSRDGSAIVWENRQAGVWRRQVALIERGPVSSVEINASGNRIVTATERGIVSVWSAAGDGTWRQTVLTDAGPVIAPGIEVPTGISAAGDRIVTANANGGATVWSAAADGTWQRQLTLPYEPGEDVAVAISPDGGLVAAAVADFVLLVWEVTGPRAGQLLVPPMIGHARPPMGLVFSPDATKLASGAEDENLIIWHIAGPEKGRIATGPTVAHRGAVTAITATSDWIVTGGIDQVARLWNWAGEKLGEQGLTGSTDRIVSVAASAHNSLLVSASGISATVWTLDVPAATRTIIDAAGPALTAATWRRNLPNSIPIPDDIAP